MADLDTFLDGIAAETTEEVTEETEASSEETTTASAETDTTTETTASEATGETDSSPESEETTSTTEDDADKHSKGLEATAIGERRRRQDAESKLQEAEQENQRLREQLNQGEEPQGKDFWEAPEEVVDSKITRVKLDLSESQARSRYADYENKLQAFAEDAQNNPALVKRMKADVDPAEFAYRHGEKVLKMQEFGDPADFEASIRAEEKARADKRVEEAVKEAKAEALKQAGNLPPSMSTERAAGGNSNPEWSGPPSLKSILK